MIDISKLGIHPNPSGAKTECGCPVRIYATDAGGEYPIHGAIMLAPDTEWQTMKWMGNGRVDIHSPSSLDLFHVPQRIEGVLIVVLSSILLLCATLPAVEIAGRTVAVDRPDDWYDPMASHHAQHAVMGIPTGLASAFIDDPVTRYGTSFASGLAVGLAYEVYESKDGAWIDVVDAGWVAAGSLLTTALVDLTGEAVQVLVTDDSAAVAVAWGF